MVKNYVAHASEEMTERYTHLSEEYARRTGDILNGLFEVQKLLWKQNGNNAQSAIA
jgi:hypothetical protein